MFPSPGSKDLGPEGWGGAAGKVEAERGENVDHRPWEATAVHGLTRANSRWPFCSWSETAARNRHLPVGLEHVDPG